MYIYERLCICMDIYGYVWTYMDIYEYLWICMDVNWHLWTFMDMYGLILEMFGYILNQ